MDRLPIPANDNPADGHQGDLFPAGQLSLVGVDWSTGEEISIEGRGVDGRVVVRGVLPISLVLAAIEASFEAAQ